MNIRSTLVLTILFLIAFAGSSLSLSVPQKQNAYSSIRDEKKSYPVHIYYSNGRDGLPETFKFSGTVVELSQTNACGDMLFGGTLKIKPSKKISGYAPEYVYVIVQCLGGIDKDLVGKTVGMKVTKSYADEKPCHCEEIQNRIESNGIPFYCTLKMDIAPSN